MPDLCSCLSPIEHLTRTRTIRECIAITYHGYACTNPKCKNKTPLAFGTEKSALRFFKEHFPVAEQSN